MKTLLAIGYLISELCLSSIAQEDAAAAFVQRYGTPNQKAKLARDSAAARRQAAAAPADYRVVTNHLFNVPLSIYWKPFKGECRSFLTNGIVMQEVEVVRTYEDPKVNSLQSIGAYAAPKPRRLLSEERILGKKFFLKNYPVELQPTTGKELRGKAMQTGTIRIGQEILEVWDCGIPAPSDRPSANKTQA